MEIIPGSNDSFLSGYADDHAIIYSFNPDNNNIKQNTENNIGKIKTWKEQNQLKMNDAKTEFIILGTSNNFSKNILDKIEIGNTKFTELQKLNFLEYILMKNLTSRITFRTD